MKHKLKKHTKVKYIRYHKFELEPFFEEDILSRDETSMFTCVKWFLFLYIRCSLKCQLDTPQDYRREHALKYKLLGIHPGGNSNHKIGNIYGQTLIAKIK